jgi:hypothetical protein
MTAVAATHGGNRVGEAFALTNGYTAAFTGAAVIALAGAVLVAVTLRTPRSGDRDAEDAARQHLTDANV